MTLLENVPLAPYTTLGVGGPARWFVEVSDDAGAHSAIQFARSRDLPLFILGGGSNLLVSDEGFNGVVLRMAGTGYTLSECSDGVAEIAVRAGTVWDEVVEFAVSNNWSGVECLAGIPGSAGATPVQNVGAYGQEVSRCISGVRALDLETGNGVYLPASECGFAYRRSVFNTTQAGRFVILEVVYRLQVDGAPQLEYRDVKQYFAERDTPRPSLAETAAAVRSIRSRKGMVLADDDPESRSAGSFFKNPVVPLAKVPGLAALADCHPDQVPQFPSGSQGTVKLSAAWLMELAGLRKGYTQGAAGLSSKHVLAIVNRGGATAGAILALRDTVLNSVQARTGIRLEQEPVMLGFSHSS